MTQIKQQLDKNISADFDGTHVTITAIGPHAKASVMLDATQLKAFFKYTREIAQFPRFGLVEIDEERVLIKDMGPHDTHMTVTNGAEIVVQLMLKRLKGRRLFYIDSEGQRGEILIKDNKFAGFSKI